MHDFRQCDLIEFRFNVHELPVSVQSNSFISFRCDYHFFIRNFHKLWNQIQSDSIHFLDGFTWLTESNKICWTVFFLSNSKDALTRSTDYLIQSENVIQESQFKHGSSNVIQSNWMKKYKVKSNGIEIKEQIKISIWNRI